MLIYLEPNQGKILPKEKITWLGAHSRSQAVWNHVVKSFARKLSTSKNVTTFLLEGGLLWLKIRSLIYHCTSCLFFWCRLWWEKLDCLRRNFLWEGCGKKRKLHLIKWKTILRLKNAGGLWIGNLEYKNWFYWWNGGDLGQKGKRCWEKLSRLSMVRMSGVGILLKSLGTGS